MGDLAAPAFACTERPLRADARRNRERILKAARAVFADQGRAAQMDDVARRAKVGVGTVYRHFPTKEALIGALADDKMQRLVALSEEALAISAPWESFEHFMRGAARQMARDRALHEAMAEDQNALRAAAGRARLQEHVGALMARAQAAGELRADVGVEQIPLTMCALSAAMHASDGCGAGWERFFAVVLDGFRAPARS